MGIGITNNEQMTASENTESISRRGKIGLRRKAHLHLHSLQVVIVLIGFRKMMDVAVWVIVCRGLSLYET